MLITKEKMLEIAQEEANDMGYEYVVFQNRSGWDYAWDYAWVGTEVGLNHLMNEDGILIKPKK